MAGTDDRLSGVTDVAGIPRLAKSMQHEPSGLWSNLQIAVQLHTADVLEVRCQC